MTKKTETPTTPIKPDGTLTTQINNQTFVIEVYFNHDSKETFQDKLLRVVLAEDISAINIQAPKRQDVTAEGLFT